MSRSRRETYGDLQPGDMLFDEALTGTPVELILSVNHVTKMKLYDKSPRQYVELVFLSCLNAPLSYPASTTLSSHAWKVIR